MITGNFNLIEYFVVFVRTAGCMMLLPGFSSVQVAMRIRLFLAVAISFSIYLLVEDSIEIEASVSTQQLVRLILAESLVAAVLALPVRFFFLALSFLGEVSMHLIGLNPIPGTPIGDDQASTVLSSLFNVTAIVLFFSSGLHLTFLFGLANSFYVLQPGEVLSISAMVENIAGNLSGFFNIVTRLAAPVIIYAVIMNLISGLVNKLTPQIPVYFVSTPFLICGGLVLFAWAGDDMLQLFILELEKIINDIF